MKRIVAIVILVSLVLNCTHILPHYHEIERRILLVVSDRVGETIDAEGFDILNSQTAIIPIICGAIDKSIQLMKYCLENGIFIQAVYPPVVPVNTSRLRATVNSAHTRADLDCSIETLKRGARKIGIL